MKNPLDKWKVLPASKLVTAPWNYKEDDAEMESKLRENLKANGLVMNLIVREIGKGKFEVVNGNHRLKVMNDLGIEEAMCFNMGKVSEEAAIRIAIETNETSFETNTLKLSDLMRRISEKFDMRDLVGSMPYQEEHIQSMLKVEKFNIDDYTKHKDPPAEVPGISGSVDANPNSAPLSNVQIHPEASGSFEGGPTVVGEGLRYEHLRVDKDVHTSLMEQIKRINKVLAKQGSIPEEELKSAGNSLALQVMVQFFAEKTDHDLQKILKRSASK